MLLNSFGATSFHLRTSDPTEVGYTRGRKLTLLTYLCTTQGTMETLVRDFNMFSQSFVQVFIVQFFIFPSWNANFNHQWKHTSKYFTENKAGLYWHSYDWHWWNTLVLEVLSKTAWVNPKRALRVSSKAWPLVTGLN